MALAALYPLATYFLIFPAEKDNPLRCLALPSIFDAFLTGNMRHKFEICQTPSWHRTKEFLRGIRAFCRSPSTNGIFGARNGARFSVV